MRRLKGDLLKEADAARTLDALLLVALKVLRLHPSMPLLEVVCGPISTGGFLGPSGQTDQKKNIRAFRFAVRALEESGRNVFDLTPFQRHIHRIVNGTHNPAVGQYRSDVLEVFCAGIYRTGKIRAAVFLPGSDDSHGCRWEKRFFDRMEIPILGYPETLWNKKVLSCFSP